MTKPIHPRPTLIIEGVKPPRIRRTKVEMQQARDRAELDSLWAECGRLAEERLARSTPAQIAVAVKQVAKWEHRRPSKAVMEGFKSMSRTEAE